MTPDAADRVKTLLRIVVRAKHIHLLAARHNVARSQASEYVNLLKRRIFICSPAVITRSTSLQVSSTEHPGQDIYALAGIAGKEYPSDIDEIKGKQNA